MATKSGMMRYNNRECYKMNIKHIYVYLILSLLSINSFAQPQMRSVSDGKRNIYYTDISDAERQITEYYKERQKYEIQDENVYSTYNPYFPYKMFVSLVSADERQLSIRFLLSQLMKYYLQMARSSYIVGVMM